MSRIGKMPLAVPADVTVAIEGQTVTVKGPKGELRRDFAAGITVRFDAGRLVVERASESIKHRSLHGLSRTLLGNMVTGVTKGFQKSLEIVGTGYRAVKGSGKITINVGYSHPVEVVPPAGIELEVPNPNLVVVKGTNREAVGQMAANIRAIREPEPYQGKGIRYSGENVRRKAGKTGKK
jgi:large subunit ribosomal protein L6